MIFAFIWSGTDASEDWNVTTVPPSPAEPRCDRQDQPDAARKEPPAEPLQHRLPDGERQLLGCGAGKLTAGLSLRLVQHVAVCLPRLSRECHNRNCGRSDVCWTWLSCYLSGRIGKPARCQSSYSRRRKPADCDVGHAQRVSPNHLGSRVSASRRAGSLVPTCAIPPAAVAAPLRTFAGRPGASKSWYAPG
jgi:hypothetical protein